MNTSKNSLFALQNGSDIRGIATEGIEGQHINLDSTAISRIAQAFVLWLAKRTGKPVSDLTVGVGHDSRISCPDLKLSVFGGILKQKASVVDCGLATTPSMFMSIVFPETSYDGAIMITASHLPYNRNGLKFFVSDGGLEHQDIHNILEIADRLEACPAFSGSAPDFDLITLYAKHLCTTICTGVNASDYAHPLKGLKIVVDAGNGSGGFFVEKILKPLGAETAGSQFLNPDGMFPNHIPNPENKEAMEAVRSATVNNHADLGLIFDTDVDRMSAVLQDGTEINRDSIIAMMAAILAPDYPGGTIITDSVTSDRLTYFLENVLGMKHLCFKRGYKNVINECKRLNAQGILSPMAMETSGHGALKENYYLDDGAFLAVKLLIAVANAKKEGKKIDSLIEKLPPLFEDREYRFKINTEDFAAYGKEVLAAFETRAKDEGYQQIPSFEGIRLSFNTPDVQGWALLRLSLHDPVMPLNLEGKRPGDCDKIFIIVKDLIKDFDKLG